MPRATPRPCPHDLRPGTTICLHCRREATLEARARFRRRFFKVATSLTVVAAIGVAAALLGVRRSAAGPLNERPRPRAVAHVAAPPRPVVVAAVTITDSGHAAAPAVATPVPAPQVQLQAQPPAPAAATPVIPQGRHDIDPTMFAERVGDTVVVHFDTPDTRTRRPDKFERTVRETLPIVYGALADSMLASVPDGQLTSAGDLVAELPTRGIRLVAPNGAAVMLWPETRPGRDGPLVVNYRVAPTR